MRFDSTHSRHGTNKMFKVTPMLANMLNSLKDEKKVADVIAYLATIK